MGDQRVIAKEYEVSSSGNKKSSLIDWGDAAQLCEYTTNHWLVYYKQLNYISLKLFPKISIPLLNIKNAELLHNSSFETRGRNFSSSSKNKDGRLTQPNSKTYYKTLVSKHCNIDRDRKWERIKVRNRLTCVDFSLS